MWLPPPRSHGDPETGPLARQLATPMIKLQCPCPVVLFFRQLNVAVPPTPPAFRVLRGVLPVYEYGAESSACTRKITVPLSLSCTDSFARFVYGHDPELKRSDECYGRYGSSTYSKLSQVLHLRSSCTFLNKRLEKKCKANPMHNMGHCRYLSY